MITLFLLITGSIGIVLAAERHPAIRSAMQKLARAYSPPGTCRSFILDILILLPLVGLLVETLTRRIKNRGVATGYPVRQVLYITAIAIFLVVSGSLYLDHINFSFLMLFMGHPEAWGGNHFMWNSGIEVLGLKPIMDTTIPTYQNFWGFWNLLALVLLGPVYIWVMVKAGTRLHGLLFGYTSKQTGISALFFKRKIR